MKLNINRRIRAGMFVTGTIPVKAPLSDKASKVQAVGIIHDVDYQKNTADFHAMNSKGETELIVRGVDLSKLSQATYAEIPKARRPNKAQAKSLGY